MGKETREMLKNIMTNTELIIKHLNISKTAPATTPKAPKAAAKKTPAKKAGPKK